MTNPYYPHLFQPLTLKNGMILKNRIFASPTHHAGVVNPPSNTFNEWGANIYKERAKGGAALVTVGEGKFGDMTTCGHGDHVNCCEPDAVFAFHNYVTYVHRFGALASIEFSHGGQFAKEDPKSASSLKMPQGWDSREMTVEDMNRVADEYAYGCLMAKKAGFDVVCLHFAHGWLIGGFLSPMVNKRTDEYGGSVENRCRFPLMILQRIRQMVGNELAIEIRLSGEEYTPNGLHIDDVVEIAKILQNEVDMIQISCGTRLVAWTRALMQPTHFVPHGHNAAMARKVKENVSVPVGCVGGISDPELAEKMIADGDCDYVVMARSLIADPDWAEKVRYNQVKDIRPCIKCMRCLDITAGRVNTATGAVLDNPKAVQKSECSVNPFFGNGQVRRELVPVLRKKKVVIIGGGIAGMQSAITAVQRGHDVVLFEKSNKLGGQLFYTDYVWFKSDMKKYRDYMIRQIQQTNVTIKMNTEATVDLVVAENPDAILIAAGATPIIPPIPGVDSKQVVTAIDMFGHETNLGQRVAVIGGGMVGCEVGLHLTHNGHDVVVVEMGDMLAPEAIFTERMHTLKLMEEDEHLTTHLCAKCTAIQPEGIIIQHKDGSTELIAADSVVLSAGFRSNHGLYEALKNCAPDVIEIGDCRQVGTIYAAVHGGYDAACTMI